MTVLDYTMATLSVSSVLISDDYVEAILISQGLEPTDSMDNSKGRGVKEALYELLPIILLSPSRITEGGYSVTYDKDALKAFYGLLAKELDKPDLLSGQPKIKDISNSW